MQNPRAIKHEWPTKLKNPCILGKLYLIYADRKPTSIHSIVSREKICLLYNNPSLWKIYFTRRYLCDNVNNFVNVTIYGDVIAFYTQSNRIYIASIRDSRVARCIGSKSNSRYK